MACQRPRRAPKKSRPPPTAVKPTLVVAKGGGGCGLEQEEKDEIGSHGRPQFLRKSAPFDCLALRLRGQLDWVMMMGLSPWKQGRV